MAWPAIREVQKASVTLPLPVEVLLVTTASDGGCDVQGSTTASDGGYSIRKLRGCCCIIENLGLDHGVGHPLLLLYDVKAPSGKNSNEFKGSYHYLLMSL